MNPSGTLKVIVGLCTGITIVQVEYSEQGAKTVRAVGRGQEKDSGRVRVVECGMGRATVQVP